MTLTAQDRAIVEEMQQRELHLKRRQRATDSIQFELRRYQVVFVAVVTLLVMAVESVLYVAVVRTLPDRPAWWVLGIVSLVLAAILGSMVGHDLLERRWGRRLVDRKESALRRKYSGDLHAGRRWLQFYYEDEDISPYVPQILSFLDAGRFDSVPEALEFAKSTRREKGALFADHARAQFQEVARQTNVLVLSSADEHGQPSSRVMRFVTSDRPGVWYVTTAPDGPKVRELDLGRVALVTVPTRTGATISSNRVRVARAGIPFSAVADLYRDQVPGYTDGMTEEEQEREVVYELALRSARVDTWVEHAVVDLEAR